MYPERVIIKQYTCPTNVPLMQQKKPTVTKQKSFSECIIFCLYTLYINIVQNMVKR